MTWTLSPRSRPALRVDLRGLSPVAMAQAAPAEVERLPVGHGNEQWPLAELFHIEHAGHPDDVATLRLQGDFSRCDRIGWQMAAGRIELEGDAGDYLGAGMSGGELRVSGSAGLLAACEMQGGHLEVGADVGDFAAGALPGSMNGMRGGTLLVRGRAGQRLGDRMRRGLAMVFGDAGDFTGSRLVAGSIAVGGRLGAHCGWGMRRGSIVCAGAPPALAPTFVPTGHDIGVFWQLLARELARHGGPFAALPSRKPARLAGDLGAGGLGELLLVH
jgi:formylmethanofuran dehydrogenase subunit C